MDKPRTDHSWTVAEAKAHLSELIDRVDQDGPQTITRRGKEIVVVVATEEWHQKTTRKGSLADFFANSPLAGSGIEIERIQLDAREVDFGDADVDESEFQDVGP